MYFFDVSGWKFKPIKDVEAAREKARCTALAIISKYEQENPRTPILDEDYECVVDCLAKHLFEIIMTISQ